jgi:hypothetical protein
MDGESLIAPIIGFRCQVSGVREAHRKILKPRVKLHHLLQKCSFFLIKLAAFLARGDARMKHSFRQDLQD